MLLILLCLLFALLIVLAVLVLGRGHTRVEMQLGHNVLGLRLRVEHEQGDP